VSADHKLIGKVCRVIGRIEPGRLGEVMVPIRGGNEGYFAYADDAADTIEAGERVVVIDEAGARTVIVSRLN
jgi:membrane protein implicated in regulation of membrane protease activity